MTLPAGALAPPTMLLEDSKWSSTPWLTLGSGVTPSAAVPMRLPTICALVE
jgi:hypothetical protein